jgi:uncharacterized protein YbjQ (UPF0145 family)
VPRFRRGDQGGGPPQEGRPPGAGPEPAGTPGPPAPDPAARAAEDQAAIEALQRGGIPPKAERRLAGLRHGGEVLFTSDLSVAEFALMAEVGLRPVSQVMGSSVYHVGWQGLGANFPSSGFGIGRGIFPLTVLSEAWNAARGLALSRLQTEARLAGADAVVGVHIQWGAHDFAPNSVEMVAVGTAVRTPGAQRTDPPVLTDLSGQDAWKLIRAGFRPVGVVGATSAFYVIPQWATQTMTTGWGGWSNAELPDFTQAFYAAREAAFTALNAQAQALGAGGVVGVSLRQEVATREVEGGGSGKRLDLIITLHVLGTGIVEGPGAPTDVHTNLDLSEQAGG